MSSTASLVMVIEPLTTPKTVVSNIAENTFAGAPAVNAKGSAGSDNVALGEAVIADTETFR